MWKAILVGGCAVILVGCGSEQATSLEKIEAKPLKLECRSGMVIHVGRNGDSTCVEQ